MCVRTARWWIRTRSWVPALLRLVGRRCAGLVPQAGLARRWWMRFSQGVFLRAGSARIRRLLLGTRLLRKLPRGPESSASLLRCYYCAPHFLLGTQRFPARFRRGSAPGSGDWPGLQNRWRALRGVLGGFDSHALPPLTNLNASRVFPKARLRQVRSPRSNQIRPVSPCAVRFRHMSGTWKVLVPRQRGITGHNQRTAAGPDRSGTGSCRQFDHPGALLLLARWPTGPSRAERRRIPDRQSSDARWYFWKSPAAPQ